MTGLVHESLQRLRTRGGRMTAQRRLILKTLDSLNIHPTAEEIFTLVRQNDATLNLSTVYRTLRWLEQEDLLVTRVFDVDSRQERFDAALPSEHHHFVCNSCKGVVEFDSQLIEQVKDEFERNSGATVETGLIVLYGLCARCQAMRANPVFEEAVVDELP